MAQRKRNRKKRSMTVVRNALLLALLAGAVILAAVLVYHRFFKNTASTAPSESSIARNGYDPEAFYQEGGFLHYSAGEYMVGVDVSEHQGQVDWQQVAAGGVEFVILRVGYRGYTEGSLQEDAYFRENYEGARAAGLKLGAYFFSQALTPEEAREEAEYVCGLLDGRALDLPVFFDWETVEGGERAPTADGLPLTQCAVAFCQTVQDEGYTAGVYFNQIFGYTYFNLGYLQDYALWLAEYGEQPEFLYHFDYLQYSDSGTVPGIAGNVDLDLWLMPQEETQTP